MPSSADQPARAPLGYCVRIRGQIDHRWLECFDQWSLQVLPDGDLLLSAPGADQSALHGLLARIRDLNLVLVSVLPKE